MFYGWFFKFKFQLPFSRVMFHAAFAFLTISLHAYQSIYIDETSAVARARLIRLLTAVCCIRQLADLRPARP